MLQCTQPFNHEHSIGTIDYCKTCHWKRILTNAGELIHTTPDCKCLNDNQSSTNVEICKKTSSLSYSCKSCLVSQKCLIRHIYIYPKHSEYDYNPFYACPVEEKKRAFLLSTTNYNVKCVIKKITTAIQLVTCGCVILVEKNN